MYLGLTKILQGGSLQFHFIHGEAETHTWPRSHRAIAIRGELPGQLCVSKICVAMPVSVLIFKVG